MTQTLDASAHRPTIQYVTTDDGYRIAYSTIGDGLPWVLVPPGFHHMNAVLEEASLRAWIIGLSQRFQLVRYDTRGQGLSQRALSTDHVMTDEVRDVEAVLDRLDPGTVVLHGNGSSAHTAIRYAAKHPERVRAMVLVHCSVTSAPWPSALMDLLAKADWDEFLRAITAPGRSLEGAKAAKDILHQMVNQQDFALKFHAYQTSDITDDLKHVRCPTLVLHLQGNPRLPLTDCANLAGLIPDGRLTEIPPSPGPWYWGDFDGAIPSIEAFVSEVAARLPAPSPGLPDLGNRLSSRELEVLRLLAAGRNNPQIADELFISASTVAKHVTSILAKTGSANRVEATSYAHRHHLV